MKLARFFFAAVAVCWTGVGLPVFGQGMADTVSNIEITALRSLQIAQSNDLYYIQVIVELRNRNPYSIRLRNAELNLRIKRYLEEIPLGKAASVDLEMPGNTTTDLTLMVEAGDKSQETLKRLFAVFNAVSNPAVVPTVFLAGTSDVGFRDRRGWVYENKFEIDFMFRPEVKRRFLMK